MMTVAYADSTHRLSLTLAEHRNRARRPCVCEVTLVGDTGFEPVTPRM
jgi:hypothetical protein